MMWTDCTGYKCCTPPDWLKVTSPKIEMPPDEPEEYHVPNQFARQATKAVFATKQKGIDWSMLPKKIADGYTCRQIANQYGVHVTTVRYHVREQGLDNPQAESEKWKPEYREVVEEEMKHGPGYFSRAAARLHLSVCCVSRRYNRELTRSSHG